MANSLKDLTYYNQMAQDMHSDRTVAAAVQQTLAQACQEGDPQALLPSIIPLLANRKA